MRKLAAVLAVGVLACSGGSGGSKSFEQQVKDTNDCAGLFKLGDQVLQDTLHGSAGDNTARFELVASKENALHCPPEPH